MVQKTVKEINKIAKLHHAALQGKITLPSVPSDSISLVSRIVSYATNCHKGGKAPIMALITIKKFTVLVP